MHIVLDTYSALDYWLSDLAPESPLYVDAICQLTTFNDMTCKELSDSIERTGGEPRMLRLLVSTKEERRRSDLVSCNAWGRRPMPPGSICEAGDGVYVISPELCLVRLAPLMSRLELLRAMSDLMGIFCRSNENRIDLIQRTPVTSIERVKRFLDNERAKGLPGSGLVLQALRWVKERVASPRETSMALMLSLPSRMGGMNLGGFEANRRIPLNDEAKLLTKRKEYLVGDVVFDDYSTPGVIKGPLLEYNSSQHHDTDEKLSVDLEKITALQRMGLTVIPVSVDQFNSYDAFAEIAQRVRQLTGVREGGDLAHRAAREVRRAATHAELLRLERLQRESASLADTSCWRFLGPYLHDWKAFERL